MFRISEKISEMIPVCLWKAYLITTIITGLVVIIYVLGTWANEKIEEREERNKDE